MNYLADTVTIVHYLSQRSKVGEQSRRLLREADQGEHSIYISAISLMEILYLAEAKRITVSLHDLLTVLDQSRNYTLVPVDARVVAAAEAIDDVPELHDRILAATALLFDAPILTPDRVLSASRHVQTIWN